MSPEVHELLLSRKVTFKIHQHAPLRSYDELKGTLPFDPSSMVKGLAFALPGNTFTIAAIRGADRADYKKIADALGIRRSDLRAATPEELESDLGMEVGGVAPLPIRGVRVLIDVAVSQHSISYCGTGRNTSTLELATHDLIRLSGAEPGNFTKGPL